MYNGSSVPCFGMKDGTISSSVSGGTPPYTYKWSNGSLASTISGVPAGYYSLDVVDAEGGLGKAQITLSEPEPLRISTTASSYPNGTNISCFECNNGTIQVVADRGTQPYSFAWSDGPSTSPNRYGLGPKEYFVTVTDANGCVEETSVQITQPQRTDWTMTGNAGTNPATQYIGTSDNKDVVFKANGQEALRLLPDGKLKVFGSLAGEGPLYRDADGVLRLGGPSGDVFPPLPSPAQCAPSLISFVPYWQLGGNMFSTPVCEGVQAIPKLGTKQEFPLHLITNNQTRMVIDTHGKVGIGTIPSGPVSGYRLFVEDGIATRDVLVKLGNWPDYVFQADHALLPLADLRTFLQHNHHLPGIPSACELEASGGVAVGEMQRALVRTVEEQALYILQLEERLQRLEARVEAVELTKP